MDAEAKQEPEPAKARPVPVTNGATSETPATSTQSPRKSLPQQPQQTSTNPKSKEDDSKGPCGLPFKCTVA